MMHNRVYLRRESGSNSVVALENVVGHQGFYSPDLSIYCGKIVIQVDGTPGAIEHFEQLSKPLSEGEVITILIEYPDTSITKRSVIDEFVVFRTD